MSARLISLAADIALSAIEDAVVQGILLSGVQTAIAKVATMPGNAGQETLVEIYMIPIFEACTFGVEAADPDLTEELAQEVYFMNHIEAVQEIARTGEEIISRACDRARKAQEAFEMADYAIGGFGGRGRGGGGGLFDFFF